MINIILFSEAGLEEAALPEGQLDVELGEKLMREPVLAYRSGWLYAVNGYTFSNGDQSLPNPQNASSPLSLTLSGKGNRAAVAVRPASDRQLSVCLAGINSFSVGHASANDLVYKDVLVSLCHGRFSREGTCGFVYADMSTNGTFVNGSFLHNARIALPDGAEILIPPGLKLCISEETLTMNWPAGMSQCRFVDSEK